jgi:hypothetical protein
MSLPRSSVLLAVLAASLLAAAPASAATRTCNIQREWTTFGVTYVTQLKVTNTTCANGKKVVRAFHKCRKAHGGVKGRCPNRVLGYRCTETRTSGPAQFSSEVLCKYGTRRVKHFYTQNT